MAKVAIKNVESTGKCKIGLFVWRTLILVFLTSVFVWVNCWFSSIYSQSFYLWNYRSWLFGNILSDEFVCIFYRSLLPWGIRIGKIDDRPQIQWACVRQIQDRCLWWWSWCVSCRAAADVWPLWPTAQTSSHGQVWSWRACLWNVPRLWVWRGCEHPQSNPSQNPQSVFRPPVRDANECSFSRQLPVSLFGATCPGCEAKPTVFFIN